MTKKCRVKLGMHRLEPHFFRHSAVLSLPAVLLRKIPIVDRARCNWTGKSVVEVNVENERRIYCSMCVHVVVKTLNLVIPRCHLSDYVKELN